MSILEEEKNRLDQTILSMEKEIEVMHSELENLRKVGNSLSFEDKKRGEHLQINTKFDNIAENIKIFKRALQNPYFGRIDFKKNFQNYVNKVYIGKSGININGETFVTDWRAPICSLYYDSEIGEVSYDAPSGKQEGNMILKRQIEIKNQKLISAIDTSLVTNDELLKPYLNNNADNKMKTIIASIQKEQNSIIRRNKFDNIIVQGVAGSGKTSVALHRIAYLIYNMGDNISSDAFIILGPNNYFLNYIASILPELETSPVSQNTLLDFTNEYLSLKKRINLKNDDKTNSNINLNIYKKIQKFKASLNYKDLLYKFMTEYLKNDLVSDGFYIDGCEIYSKEKIKNVLFSDNNNIPNFKKANLYLVNNYKNICYSIYAKENEKYRKIYTILPKDDKRRIEAVIKSEELLNNIIKNGIKFLKKYLHDLEQNPLDLYIKFIDSLSSINIPYFTEKEKCILQSETIKDIKKKNVTFTDLSALLYINYLYTNKTLDYKNIIIDEAQDYGLFHFACLKEIMPNAVFSIYGDLAQAIYSYRSINSWEDVKNKIFNSEAEILNLSKSYRTTVEITNNANKVLSKLDLKAATPVIRHGATVVFENKANNINYKTNLIYNWLNKNYKSIAIICKEEKEAQNINIELQKMGILSNYLSSNDVKYDGGVQVLTSASAKGLEFDAVIVNDASEKKYSSNDDVDMHLLYVSCTRALHEQVILYDKNINNAFNDCIIEKETPKEKIKTR